MTYRDEKPPGLLQFGVAAVQPGQGGPAAALPQTMSAMCAARRCTHQLKCHHEHSTSQDDSFTTQVQCDCHAAPAAPAPTFLLVSWISPPMMNSSRMQYTCGGREHTSVRTEHACAGVRRAQLQPPATGGRAVPQCPPDLVEAKHQVQLAHVAKVVVQDLLG